MAVNNARYRALRSGMGHRAALLLADPAKDNVECAAVSNPTAMSQAAITGGESPTEAEFNALRTDLVNTRTTLQNLLTSLRAGGVLLP